MVSIDKCKKILTDKGNEYTNDEVIKIREFLYKSSKIVIDSYKKEKNESS